jgi:type I restriction enzyme S subunit
MRPYLRVANVFEDHIDLSDVMEMNFTPDEFERFRLRSGDVLLNEGQSLELVGRPAIYRDQLPGSCFTNSLIRFQPHEGVVPEYACYLFRHFMHNGRFSKIAKITTNIAHLGAERFADVDFPLPPTAEQRRIVEALETHFTRLDATVATLERVRASLDDFASHAVSGFVCPDWRSAEWGATALPASWKWRPAEEVCVHITKGATPPATAMTAGSGDVPFLKIQHLGDRGTIRHVDRPVFIPVEVHRTLLARSTVFPGDVLMNIVGPPLGQVGIVPSDYSEWNINQAIARFRPRPGVLSGYLAAALRASSALRWLERRAKTTAGQVNLTLETCRELPVPVPPPSVQSAICAQVDALESQLIAAATMVAAATRRCARLRQSVLRVAFSGRLVLQDPRDEPASVLLDRIRRERDAASRVSEKRTARSCR